MKTHLKKWGNSLAIRIPREVVSRARLQQGDELELEVLRRGTLRVRRSGRKRSLAALVRGISSKNRHRDADWGVPKGAEAW